jgi:hypothetical protein
MSPSRGKIVSGSGTRGPAVAATKRAMSSSPNGTARIGAASRAEHYGIAGYTAVIAMAPRQCSFE